MRLIGVTPFQDEKTGRFAVNHDYLDAVHRAGALPVVLPLIAETEAWDEMLRRVDGVLLSGGADVEPGLYGEEKLPVCGDVSAVRDAAELGLCRMAIERDVPLLCICRGLQVLNVALGGTLYQDIAAQFGGPLTHPRNDTPRDPVHGVRAAADSRLFQITGLEEFRVNSRHHQAIKVLGKGLKCSARAEDGLIEGAELPSRRFVVGVQWHPESLSDRYPEAQALFDAFVRACRE